MIMTRERPEVDLQDGAHLLEGVEEFTICVNNNNGDKAKGKNNLFHKYFGKDGGRSIGDDSGDDKLGEIAHSVEKTDFTFARDAKVARQPKVKMHDVEGGCDWPGEIQFTLSVAPDVIGNTTSTAFYPVGNILTHLRPMEAETKTKKGFV